MIDPSAFGTDELPFGGAGNDAGEGYRLAVRVDDADGIAVVGVLKNDILDDPLDG